MFFAASDYIFASIITKAKNLIMPDGPVKIYAQNYLQAPAE